MSRLLAVKATLRVTRGAKWPSAPHFRHVLGCKGYQILANSPAMKIELNMGVESAILAVRTPLKIPSDSRSWRKKKELAIMTEKPNYHRIRQFGRIFIEFYNGNLVLAIPQKDNAIGNGNPIKHVYSAYTAALWTLHDFHTVVRNKIEIKTNS